MFEFLPWSQKTLQEALAVYQNEARMSILDIELGGACNMCCIYCDTPSRKTTIKYDLQDIQQLLVDGKISWLFICGLGEPTAHSNILHLKEMLKICSEYNVKCCMFSNIVNFDNELFSYVDSGVLYPMFKLDGLDPELLSSLYGVERDVIDRQLKNVFELSKHVNNDGLHTNICASIVLTSKNIDYLPKLIKWCEEKGIFPLIGDLEDAGKGQAIFNNLKVSENKLFELSNYIECRTGSKYAIPICPSVLFGVHINHLGDIVVDKLSGLSCHWFWLKEPEVEVLSSIKGISFSKASKLIIENRKIKRKNVQNIIPLVPQLVFGGCGGNIYELLEFYIKQM